MYKENLFINHDYLDLLEKSFKSKDLETLGGRMFETSIIMIHEYSHYLNVKSNRNWLEVETHSEQGALFEKMNFKQFSYGTNSGGFGTKNQYYQQNATTPKMSNLCRWKNDKLSIFSQWQKVKRNHLYG